MSGTGLVTVYNEKVRLTDPRSHKSIPELRQSSFLMKVRSYNSVGKLVDTSSLHIFSSIDVYTIFRNLHSYRLVLHLSKSPTSLGFHSHL